MAPRSIKVVPLEATAAAVDEMMALMDKAFGPDPLVQFCFPQDDANRDPPEKRRDAHLARIAGGKCVYYQAVDADHAGGPMLGAALWYRNDDPRGEPDHSPHRVLPPGVHEECFAASSGVLRTWRNEHFRQDNQPYLYMWILAVHPDAQRQGVGSALLREGLKEADRRGIPSFIEATPAGLGLYKKFGYEETVATNVNLKTWGGADVQCPQSGLVRAPGAKETTGFVA